jgi:hypothetical protein
MTTTYGIAAEIETVTVEIDTYGKAGQYGPDVYKVGAGARQLTAAGWETVRRTSSYVYMRAPAGQGTKRPRMSLSVPTRDTVRKLAEQLHAAGAPWRGTVFGWPASYTPYREGAEIVYVVKDGVGRNERQEHVRPASFSIGELNVWSKYAQWDNGPASPPRWVEE